MFVKTDPLERICYHRRVARDIVLNGT